MPEKDQIELGSGRLYFKGVEEPIEVNAADIVFDEEEVAEDVRHINLSMEPVTFECEAEFNRNWTLVECKECGSKIPVTEFYTLLCGTKGWTCPRCVFNKAIEDARRKTNDF